MTDITIASELIDAFDVSAVRIKDNRLSREELENIEDARDIRKGLEEYRRTGKTYAWEDIKAELGL